MVDVWKFAARFLNTKKVFLVLCSSLIKTAPCFLALNSVGSWFNYFLRSGNQNTGYCRFSYTGTWELVNLFVGQKILATIFVIKTGRKHNKNSEVKREIQIDHGQTELSNMLVKKNVLNEINKEGTFTQGFKDCRKIKRKVS